MNMFLLAALFWVLFCKLEIADCADKFKVCPSSYFKSFRNDAALPKYLQKIGNLCYNGGTCLYDPKKVTKKKVSQGNLTYFFEQETMKCSCDDGFTGELCDTADCQTLPKPCYNFGQCSVVTSEDPPYLDEIKCKCLDTYTGERCEEKLNQTTAVPCRPGQKLSESVNCLYGKCTKLSSVIKKLQKLKKKARNPEELTKLITVFETKKHLKNFKVCECKTGKKGLNCNHECTNNTYGDYCSNSCGRCADNKPCDIKTGKCGSCEPGYTKPMCKEDHNYKCSPKTCVHGKCQTVGEKEICVCETGWVGQKCKKKCGKHFYGDGCLTKCGMCRKLACDHVTGDCFSRCVVGWIGAKCDEMKLTIRADSILKASLTLDDGEDRTNSRLSRTLSILSDASTLTWVTELDEADDRLSDFDDEILDIDEEPLGGRFKRDIERASDRTGLAKSTAREKFLLRKSRLAAADLPPEAVDILVGFGKLFRTASRGVLADSSSDEKSSDSSFQLSKLSFDVVTEDTDGTDSVERKKRQATAPAIQADFSLDFAQGSVEESSLQDSLTTSLQQASDEVNIPGVVVDKNSIRVRQVQVVNQDESPSALSTSTVGGLAAAGVLMVLSMVVLVVIGRKNRKRTTVNNNPDTKRSRAGSRSRSTTSAHKSRSKVNKSASLSHSHKSRHSRSEATSV